MKKYNILMNLQMFADGGSGEKTERPTPKKREEARKEGQVASSKEITTALILVGMFSMLKFMGPGIAKRLIGLIQETVLLFEIESLEPKVVHSIGVYYMTEVILMILPILAMSFFIGLVSNLAQVGWKITGKPLMPKFSKLNPIKGVKNIVSMKSLVELVKSILKLAIILLIVYLTLRDYEKLIFALYDVSVFESYALMANIIFDVGIKVGMYFILVAAIDFAYTKYKHEKDLKMTKQEVKEERKLSDGNPEIKSKIRQKMREASMRRMMQDLPTADVIITNPTHFAVAITYDENGGGAPTVIAKGADLMAARIREKAREHEIEIVENKPLARTLYYTVEIGDEIPPELYQAVAEVLAFVFSIKNGSA